MLILPTASTPAGASAGVVFYDQQGRSTARARAMPSDRSTARQWSVRPRFRSGRVLYSELGNVDRQNWINRGASEGIPAADLFCTVFIIRSIAGLAYTDDPLLSGPTGPSANLIGADIPSPGDLRVTWQPPDWPLEARFNLYVSWPQAPAEFELPRHWRLLTTGVVAANSGGAIETATAPSPWPVTAGQVVYLTVSSIDLLSRYTLGETIRSPTLF